MEVLKVGGGDHFVGGEEVGAGMPQVSHCTIVGIQWHQVGKDPAHTGQPQPFGNLMVEEQVTITINVRYHHCSTTSYKVSSGTRERLPNTMLHTAIHTCTRGEMPGATLTTSVRSHQSIMLPSVLLEDY